MRAAFAPKRSGSAEFHLRLQACQAFTYSSRHAVVKCQADGTWGASEARGGHGAMQREFLVIRLPVPLILLL